MSKRKFFLGMWDDGIGLGIATSILDFTIICLAVELILAILWILGNAISYWLGGPCYYVK